MVIFILNHFDIELMKNHQIMRTYIIAFFFALQIISGSLEVKAQVAPSFSFELENTYQSATNLLDTIWGKKYIVSLDDTNDVAKIHLKMGTTSGGGEVYSKTILYDQTSNLPIGFTYSREGDSIEIKAGGYSYGFYYYEVKLEDDSSNVSLAQTWNSGM